MSYAIERAIRQGIEMARNYRKDPPETAYDMRHPMFNFWWAALVKKADCPDWSEGRIAKEVMAEVTWRGVG